MNENAIINRLQEFIDEINYSKSQLAREIGCSATAMIDYLEHGKTIGKIIQQVIEHFPNLSTEWLFRGEGEMFKSQNSQPMTSCLLNESTDLDELLRIRILLDDRQAKIDELEKRNIALQKSIAVLEYINQHDKKSDDVK